MLQSPFSLKDKTILITGASSGIGRSTAIECAKMGATIIAMGRNEKRLIETVDSLEGIGHVYHAVDLNDIDKVIELLPQINKLDGLVNSAGIVKQELFSFLKQENFESIMNINFNSPILFIQKLIKKKKFKKPSSIVFISSISGPEVTYIGSAAYCASKSALTGIAKTMALELSSKGIRVNCLLPGMVHTELLDDTILTEDDLKKDEQLYPLKYGKPEDVAHAAIYLLSCASKWVTGTDLKLDGGFTLR